MRGVVGIVVRGAHLVELLGALEGLLVLLLAVVQALHGLQVVQSLLESAVFQVLLGYWEQVAQVQEDFTVYTHKTGLSTMFGSSEAYVGFKITYDLIVTKDRVWRQQHKVFNQELIEHGYSPLLNEVYLAELLPIAHYSQVRFVYPREHIDYQLIHEPSLTVLKEMFEVCLKVLKYRLHYLSLHLGRYLLIEVELFNNQIKIVHEGIMHVLLDVTVKVRGDIVGLVRTLYLFNPDIQETQLFIDETLEVVGFLQHIINAAHEEGEETQTDKL